MALNLEGGMTEDVAAQVAQAVARFRERVAELNSTVTAWLGAVPRTSAYSKIVTITEDLSGTYEIPELDILFDKLRVVSLRPTGAFVVAAQGRIDVLGTIDKAILVWLDDPRFESTIKNESGAVLSRSSVPIFNGVTAPGWYRIDDGRRSAVALTRETFLQMLTEVTDLDFAAK
jgi:hypothetical protein